MKEKNDKERDAGIKLKEIILAGIGMIATAAEKAKVSLKETLEKGRASVNQNDKVLEEALKNGTKVIDSLKERYEKMLEYKLVKESTLDSLNERVDQLERRLEKLEVIIEEKRER